MDGVRRLEFELLFELMDVGTVVVDFFFQITLLDVVRVLLLVYYMQQGKGLLKFWRSSRTKIY